MRVDVFFPSDDSAELFIRAMWSRRHDSREERQLLRDAIFDLRLMRVRRV